MLKSSLVSLFAAALMLTQAGAGSAQKKQGKCEEGNRYPRNWEVVGQEYVYFDYVLCPADMNPPQPAVRIWITWAGKGIAVEKWAQERDRADVVSVFQGKKKSYTLYRDLNAVPFQVLKAERRPGVPVETASQPFMVEGSMLIPFDNLTSESAARAGKVFESADILIRSAQKKVPLIHESARIGAVVQSLGSPLKVQQ